MLRLKKGLMEHVYQIEGDDASLAHVQLMAMSDLAKDVDRLGLRVAKIHAPKVSHEARTMSVLVEVEGGSLGLAIAGKRGSKPGRAKAGRGKPEGKDA